MVTPAGLLLRLPDFRSFYLRGQASKGEAGKSSILYKLAPAGLSAQAYLTHSGSFI